MVSCKKCGEARVVKAGYQSGCQRYECKCCGCNFIEGDRRGNRDGKLKSLAVLLYSQGKGSYGFIGKLMNKHRSTVYRWVKKMAQALPDPVIDQGVNLLNKWRINFRLCLFKCKFQNRHLNSTFKFYQKMDHSFSPIFTKAWY